jgi:predicted TIM-barrel fold metal-dependent hydrolase
MHRIHVAVASAPVFKSLSLVAKRSSRFVLGSVLVVGGATAALGQNFVGPLPPVIDVHFHSQTDSRPGAQPFCPNESGFTASDPKNGKEENNGWTKESCTPPLYPAPPGEYLKMLTDDMKRLNVTAIVFGNDADAIKKYEAAAPGRIIPGIGFGLGVDGKPTVTVEQLREYYTKGGFKVMGEIGLQYNGISPSDPRADPYFALAEELDIPVAIHMGTGGSGRSNIGRATFRAASGDPLLLEEMLAKHPKLRVQVMHAGYPMAENMLALLQTNSHVYVDIAGLIWSYPIKEVNHYIQRLVEGGFEDRVMFGTDQSGWPGLMAYSISLIQNAEYLTPQEKRDILYNNAARFLRIDLTKK